MKTKIVATIAAVAVLGLAGCATSARDQAVQNGMSTTASLACEDFASGYGKVSSEDRGARIELARKVNEWAQKDSDLRPYGDRLASAATSTGEVWVQVADEFANQCFDLGWP